MSHRSFFTEDARSRVAAAVAEVEGQTSAEIIVALRKSSGHYRHTDYLVGILLATASLLIFLFYPEPFDVDAYPIEAAAFFAFGCVTSAFLPPLRRALTSRRLMEQGTRTAARAAFVELGVSRTRGRTGVLVFVSMFERRVEVVADIGVDEAALVPAFRDALQKLERAVREGEIDRFLDGLRSMGPALACALPRAADDINELPDEVRA
jgi:putative membrane protein